MEDNFNEFFSLVKSTRLYRPLTILTAIMVPVSFVNKISLDIFFLGTVFLLIYAAGGIHNAKKDKDYKLPEYSNKIIYLFFTSGIIISFTNKIIFFTCLSLIFLTFIYNTLSRKILFGDVTILSISHNALPIFISSLLVGLSIQIAIKLSLFMFTSLWFVIHVKNLKDIKEDKKRGYKTIATYFKNYRKLTKIFIGISFIFFLSGYFLFSLSFEYLFLMSVALFFECIIIYKINHNQDVSALNFMRLLVIIIFIGFILGFSNNLKIILVSLIFCFFFLLFLIYNEIQRQKDLF